MEITQLRNATIIVEANGHGILVDPMLGPVGSIMPLKWLTKHRRRNPLVELPPNHEDVLARVTHCLITHRHPDHIDPAGAAWLAQRDIPVYCVHAHRKGLDKMGLQTHLLNEVSTNEFLGGTIEPTPAQHGRGLSGKLMGHVAGYVIRLPGQPSLYLAGDTVLTDAIKACIKQHAPDVAVIPAGGARLDFGGEIIMGLEEAVEFGRLCAGDVIANHLESLDHCPVTRSALREAADKAGSGSRFKIPSDGESISVTNR